MVKDEHDKEPSGRSHRGPTLAQLDAAIEGARDPTNFNAARLHPETPPARGMGDGSAGRPPAGDPDRLDPEEAIKRETAIFEPGTGHKAKPVA